MAVSKVQLGPCGYQHVYILEGQQVREQVIAHFHTMDEPKDLMVSFVYRGCIRHYCSKPKLFFDKSY